MQDPTKGADAPDINDGLAALIADCDAYQDWFASLSESEREQLARLHEIRNAEFTRRTIAARKRGWNPREAVDFSAEWRAASRHAVAHVARERESSATGVAMPIARNREHRPAFRRRASSSSRTSSADPGDADPEPSEEGLCDCGCNRPRRYCACGCRREITHRRAGAKTFGATCRQRIAREARRIARRPLEPRFCQCESGFFYRDAEGDAVCGLCGCWLAKVGGSILHADYQLAEALLRDNGTYVPFRPIPRKWFDTQQEYRRRQEARS